MDKQRLIAFWLLTGLIFMIYFQYQARMQRAAQQAAQLAQQADREQADREQAEGEAGDEGGPPVDGSGAPDGNGNTAADATAEIDRLNWADDQPADAEPDDSEPAVPQPQNVEYAVLGSLGRDSVVVYLTNRGASVARIELSDPQYGDVEERYGYLGFLGLDYAASGCIVHTVAPGSPAATAKSHDPQIAHGLTPGDRILRCQEQDVPQPIDLDRCLAKTRPRQDVELVVEREIDGAPRELAFTATLTKHPVAIIQSSRGDDQPIGENGPPSFQLTLAQVDNVAIPFGKEEFKDLPSLREGLWQMVRLDERTVEFRRSLTRRDLRQAGLAGQWDVVKRYRLPAHDLAANHVAENAPNHAENAAEDARPYHVEFDIELQNRSDESHRVAWRLDGPNGLPTEGWWYSFKTHPRDWGAAGTRDVVFREPAGQHQMLTARSIAKQTQKPDEEPEVKFVGSSSQELEYVGVDTQYFCVALQRGEGEPEGSIPFARGVARMVQPVDNRKLQLANVSFRIDSPLQEVAAGESWKESFLIYAGPKRRDLLAQYGLQDCIVYGWAIFRSVAQPMTRLLHGFYAIVGNFGVSIVLLTVLVRGLMFPLSRQQVANAKRMQELGPEMQRIKQKYKNEPEQAMKAQRELWQKHNVNPFSGCLPMFVQLPIFIGLYRCLSVDVALRGAPLVPGISWCSNLAAPDQLLNWSSFLPEVIAGRSGYLGPYLNILPLISAAFMLVQQKMFTPPPADEQQEAQQKMMGFMTIFMGFLFFKVPSGLCLYFISSSLWALAERKLLPQRKSSAPSAAPPSRESSAAPAPAPPGKALFAEWFPKSAASPSRPISREERQERRKRRRRRD